MSHINILRIFFSIWVVEQSNGKFNYSIFCVYNYIFSTKVLNFYDNSASRQFCSRRSSRHVFCIIHMPCRLLVLHAPLYTNIVDRKSGPFGGNLDKNAKNWLEQGALAIFWRFLTPGNKWCLDWSWFQTIYPISICDILSPFPVTKCQSQTTNLTRIFTERFSLCS